MRLGTIKKAKEIGKKNYNKFIWQACVVCGKERWVMIIRDKPRDTRCKGCGHRGENHFNWKGGRIKKSCGYVLVKIPNPFPIMEDNRGYIREHRLVMAQYLDRPLKDWEIVHHRNHIRNDNRIENLRLHEISDHQAITILETKIKKLEEEIKRLRVKGGD